MSIEISEFDIKNATDQAYEAFNQCSNQIKAERLPDDPPTPLEESIQGLKNIPDYLGVQFWTARAEDADIIAYGMVYYSLEDNLHMGQFGIYVTAPYRRKGLGKAFLSRIVKVAQAQNRRLLIASTNGRVPAGEAFMTRMGARKGLTGHTNQLAIAELDRALISRWIVRAKERAGGFEIGVWEGRYPEEEIDAIVNLHQLLNQQPFEDLEIEDFTFSAENIRQDENHLFARGNSRWTLFVREKSTGRFAGYTETYWNPNRPEIVNQGMTGVFPEYRNKGLGRWLKADMLERILKELPGAKFVRTGNADSNAPMIKINNELGFKPYIADSTWQVETEKVAKYLGTAA